MLITIAYAADGNMDGGGGGMEDASKENFWNIGNEGVRVTVVDKNTNSPMLRSLDFTNINYTGKVFHGGGGNKINYKNGKKLSLKVSGYNPISVKSSIPQIISSNGSSNISAVKEYFCDENTIRYISEKIGFPYEQLINGDYVLMIEPIAYFTYAGQKFAFTATEAAMFDTMKNGLVRKVLGNLTHKNLPLAMFLEYDEIGFGSWTGSTNRFVNSSEIINYLGIGTVRFDDFSPNEDGDKPTISSYDYIYRVDTDVITAVTVSGGQSDPKNPTTVSFSIEGRTYNVSNVYYPEGDSQLVWVKWHTPRTPKNIVINVSVRGPGSPEKATINCKIEDLNQNPPPNPTADDRNDSFTQSSIPIRAERTSASWSVWKPKWHKHMVDNGYYKTHHWQDSKGNWHSKDV